jgi:hypothetical protein
MASLYLDGIVAEWHYALERDVGHMQWLCFSDFVNIQSPPHYNGLAKLKELRRIGTIEAYQRQFLRYCSVVRI